MQNMVNKNTYKIYNPKVTSRYGDYCFMLKLSLETIKTQKVLIQKVAPPNDEVFFSEISTFFDTQP